MILARVTPADYDDRAMKPGNVWRTEYAPATLLRLEQAASVALSDGERTITREIVEAWRYVDAIDENGQPVGGINVLLGKKITEKI